MSATFRRYLIAAMVAALLTFSLGATGVAQSGFEMLILGKDVPWNILIGCRNSSDKPIASPQPDGKILVTCMIN